MTRSIAAALLACAVLVLPACVQVSGPPPRTQRRDLPTEAPAGTPINVVVLSVAPFIEDMDSDRYPDTISASVFLFPDPRVSPLPVHTPGTMVFDLISEGEEPRLLARWTYSPEELLATETTVDVGAVHMFALNLNLVATDRMPRQAATIRATFLGTNDIPPVSSSPITVVVGAGTAASDTPESKQP